MAREKEITFTSYSFTPEERAELAGYNKIQRRAYADVSVLPTVAVMLASIAVIVFTFLNYLDWWASLAALIPLSIAAFVFLWQVRVITRRERAVNSARKQLVLTQLAIKQVTGHVNDTYWASQDKLHLDTYEGILYMVEFSNPDDYMLISAFDMEKARIPLNPTTESLDLSDLISITDTSSSASDSNGDGGE